MALILPNSIDNDTPADAAELEQNFNVVETYVNTNVLHRDGSVAPTAPILLPGDPTQPNHAANMAYVDAKAATAATATSLKVSKAGDTMTGQLKGITPVAIDDLTRKDYVDTQDTAYYNSAVAGWQAYADLHDADRVARTGDTMSGSLYWNADPFSGYQGSLVTLAGQGAFNLHTASNSNLYLFHSGSAFHDGNLYAFFGGQTGGHTNGAIIQSGSNAVAYYSASDYRSKNDLGPVEDPVGKLMALQPKHLQWKSDQREFDGFIAHELADVVPNAVAGIKDATNPDGSIRSQMVDATNVVPLLTAALQEAHTMIADLTARLEVLEAAA